MVSRCDKADSCTSDLRAFERRCSGAGNAVSCTSDLRAFERRCSGAGNAVTARSGPGAISVIFSVTAVITG
jgi:hypothetical protein